MDLENILDAVEAFLRESGMSATAFGERAMRDPKFVFDLRGGKRELLPSTSKRVVGFMDGWRAAKRRPKKRRAA